MASRPYVQAWPVWCPTHRFGMVRILPSTSLPESPGWVNTFTATSHHSRSSKRFSPWPDSLYCFHQWSSCCSPNFNIIVCRRCTIILQSFHLQDLMLAIAFSKMESCLLPRGPQAGNGSYAKLRHALWRQKLASFRGHVWQDALRLTFKQWLAGPFARLGWRISRGFSSQRR